MTSTLVACWCRQLASARACLARRSSSGARLRAGRTHARSRDYTGCGRAGCGRDDRAACLDCAEPHGSASTPDQAGGARRAAAPGRRPHGDPPEHWVIGIGLRENFVGSGFESVQHEQRAPPVFGQRRSSPLRERSAVARGARALRLRLGESERACSGHVPQRRAGHGGRRGRYHFWRRFYLFGRVAPGALYSGATLSDPIAGGEQHSNSWAFATDLSLGAAVEFAGEARGASNRPRGWIGFGRWLRLGASVQTRLHELGKRRERTCTPRTRGPGRARRAWWILPA